MHNRLSISNLLRKSDPWCRYTLKKHAFRYFSSRFQDRRFLNQGSCKMHNLPDFADFQAERRFSEPMIFQKHSRRSFLPRWRIRWVPIFHCDKTRCRRPRADRFWIPNWSTNSDKKHNRLWKQDLSGTRYFSKISFYKKMIFRLKGSLRAALHFPNLRNYKKRNCRWA